MHERTLHFVVSFPTTHAAIEAEQTFQAAGLPGRLVPLPPAMDASCGLAWKSPIAEKERVEQMLQTMTYDKTAELLLF